MSLITNKLILLITTLIITLIKTEKQASRSLSSIRFLIEEKDDSLFTESENNKSQMDSIFESFNQIKPLRIFQESYGSSGDNEGFKVRCFWLDSKTMRVFDLSGLKTAK